LSYPRIPHSLFLRTTYERLDQLLSAIKAPEQPGVSALRAELARARVVESKEMPAGVVTMNSQVRLLNESTGETHELSLVYPRDADGGAGKVSVLAPVGSALVGLKAGQSIDWPMPNGHKDRLKVLDVMFQGVRRLGSITPESRHHRPGWQGRLAGLEIICRNRLWPPQ
jgi:regulator of nucleoside diphosphate kinase